MEAPAALLCSPLQPYQGLIIIPVFHMKRLRLSEAKEGTQILSKRQSQYLTPDLSDPKVQAPSTTPSFFPDSKGLGSFPQLPASGRLTLMAPTTLDPSPEAEG